jgi:ribosomal protein L25 (general stress protein Ctc)
MIEALSLQAEPREQIGSKAAAAVRRKGRIPAIVYGHKQAPAPSRWTPTISPRAFVTATA